MLRKTALILLAIGNICLAQSSSPVDIIKSTHSHLNSTQHISSVCIENIGQYGKKMAGFENMGPIQYGYEGLDMPVLITEKGLIQLQRKIKTLSHQEEEKLEKKGMSEAEIERLRNITDRVISMEWEGANPAVEIIAADKTSDYHTYGLLPGKAAGYRKITYKNMYPGIDIIYSFNDNGKPGFEYSLLVQPGADLAVVKMKFGGDIKSIKTDINGDLLIRSDINGMSSSIPVSYYADRLQSKPTANIKTTYTLNDREIGFSIPQSYDHTKAFVIDPFVTATSNLNGVNAGKAKDVDFDYAGNVYVTGGGDGSSYKLAKYNGAGVLQWTFNGSTSIPTWTFGPYYGGWVVEKNTGNIYLGQGFNPTTGYKVIRISTTGLYDNYVSNGNINFNENWKMYWSCNNGSPQILVVGGGTSSNLNLGILSPPSTTITPLNITGIPASVCQDMVDMVFDPTTFDIYTVFASLFVTPVLNDKIYKNTAPYNDNSANILSLNASYLYYWDGKNLKAFNKTTGAGVGTALVTANTKLMQGGIIADACDNIFVGEGNGVIKVYKFNGSNFDDAAAPDILIPGFNGKAVYDLAYDEARKLIYASGDGFVGSFDISTYCTTTSYGINVAPDCLTGSAMATVTPAPPSGSVVTYTLYSGNVQLTSNTAGLFTGVSPNILYTLTATINLACSGTQATTTFTVPGPTVNVIHTDASCGAASGSITATGSGTIAPYTYSLDGISFQPGGVFSAVPAGVYTITVKDANGCKNTASVTVLNANGPSLTFSSTNANCGNNNGTITANVSGGTAPYQFSINGTTYQTNNFFTGLVGGTYILTVKDAGNCINVAVVIISSSPAPLIAAIPAAATCGSSNGSITAFGSAGTAPLEYSINGNIFQPGNVFTNLAPGTYTVTVRDVNHCINTTIVTISNSPAPTVTASSTTAACNNVNGTITATGSGGIAPLQYSIDGVNFQTGNIFTGLAAGNYTVLVKDATGCTNMVTVTVTSTGGPIVSAISTVSSCTTNTGSITATASGGQPGYQYSVNGSTFQASNIFTGLAAGNYVVYVRDVAGCIGTFSIIVGNIAGPSLIVASTPTSCNINDGTITITGSGGTPGYQYSIDGIVYQPGNIFTGLAAGNYTAYIKDANGCIKTAGLIVTNISGLSLLVNTIVSSCNINNGVITATATGGVAPLLYSINGTTYQGSNIFNGLTAGTYTVYVKDANGCIVTKSATVGSVGGPVVSLLTFNGTCGTASGVIVASATGGLLPLSYNIDGGAFQSTGSFINLAAGTHTIVVKDATGCSSSQSATISNPGSGTAPTDVTFTIRDVLPCTGGLGKIKNLKGVPGGGGNTYTFSLDFGPYTTSNQFTNVSIGTHTVTAKNQNGCTVTRLATIGTGIPATATAVATSTACNTSNGTITITGVGANTPYHASIDNGVSWVTFFPPGANSFTFTGLAPGTYPIIIADDADFTAGPPDIPGACLTTIFVAVPSTGGPSISTTQINGTCNSNNGSITANGAGGTAPYTYNINGGAYFASGVFNNLAPGMYAVTVKDATGCITGVNVTLTNPSVPLLTADIQPTSCNLNNGTITATVTGGVPPFQYSINGTIFQASNIFTGIAAGTYTLYAKDVNECYSTLPVTISSIPIPLVTAFTIAATCNNNDGSIIASGSSGTTPYTYSIDGIVYQSSNTFNGLTAGFYTIYIKDARDCMTTTGVAVGNTGAPVITATSSTSANCGNPTGTITVTASGGSGSLEYSDDGINFQLSTVFTGLLPGTYTITVRDVNGCLNTKVVTVTTINGPQTLTASIINAACGFNNGIITATASGGAGALQYSIDGITYQSSPVFSGVGAGGYTVYARDANLCIKTLPVTILNLAGPVLTTIATPASCGLDDGTITANATGGTGVLTYSKDGLIFQNSNIFLGLAANTYTITVKDERGCNAVTSVTVTTSTINFNGTLASFTGGSQSCRTAPVLAGGTSYFDPLCTLIDRLVPSGVLPINGTVNNCVIIDGSVQSFNGEPYVQRHFDIEPVNNPSSSTATVTLYFKDQEFVDFNAARGGFPALPTIAGGGNSDPNISNLRVTQYHGIPIAPHNMGNPAPGFYSLNGGAGILIIPTTVIYNSSFNYWEITFPVTGFSGFYVHTNLFSPLPITLNYFAGIKHPHTNVLNWKLNCNGSPATIILERRNVTGNFSAIYSISTDAFRCQQPFEYTDAVPLAGMNYYRLKMIAPDGRIIYSSIVALMNNSNGPEIINIVPNPVINGSFKLNISSSEATGIEIVITDLLGRQVNKQQVQVITGLNDININVSYLASGTYFIKASTDKDKVRILRFVKE